MGTGIPPIIIAELIFIFISLVIYGIFLDYAKEMNRKAEAAARRLRQDVEWEEQLQRYPFLRAIQNRETPLDLSQLRQPKKVSECVNWTKEGF